MVYQISWDVINHVSKLIIRLRHRRVELVGNSHGYGVVGRFVGKVLETLWESRFSFP